MFEHLLAAVLATALVAAPFTPAFAQAASEKTSAKKTAKAKKELTPQQQKMKDCGPKWADYKKEKERQGPRRVPKIHEHLPEGLARFRRREAPLQTHRGRRRDCKSLRRPLPSISPGRPQINSASTRGTHR